MTVPQTPGPGADDRVEVQTAAAARLEAARTEAASAVAAGYLPPTKAMLGGLGVLPLMVGVVLLLAGTLGHPAVGATVFAYVLGLPLCYLGVRMLAPGLRWTRQVDKRMYDAAREVRRAKKGVVAGGGSTRGPGTGRRVGGIFGARALPFVAVGILAVVLNTIRLISDLH